jgi:hypothetical protein
MIKPVFTSARLALAAGLLLLSGREAHAACSFEKVAQLHVSVENNQILIPGVLQGKKVKFLFDTSSPASFIPAGAASRLRLPVSSFNQPAYLSVLNGYVDPKDYSYGEVTHFTLDGAEIKDTVFRVFGSLESANFGGPDTVALLGTDFWKGYEVDVDLPHTVITLFHAKECSGNLAYWTNSYNVVDLQRYGARTSFGIKLDGHDMSAVLDSGSPYSTLTDKAAATIGIKHDSGAVIAAQETEPGTQATDLPSLLRVSYGLGLDPIYPNIQSIGFPTMPEAAPVSAPWLARLNRLVIDQETISPVNLRVVKTPQTRSLEVGSLTLANDPVHYDVLLGVDFLMTHHVLIANSQNKLYFNYVGGAVFGTPSEQK